MAHFALVKDGIVQQVIVAEKDFIDTLTTGVGEEWLQTSYNTHSGVHTLGGEPLRKNFAGPGYEYHKDIDAFMPPKPFPSWKRDTQTGLYKAPKANKLTISNADETIVWDESELKWVIALLTPSPSAPLEE